MRILMLGNSYIFVNDLPSRLAELTGAEVVQHTRGGARLAEHLNAETENGAKTARALTEETWDYVVLQEQSNAPVTTRDKFLKSAEALCSRIHSAGAMPVMYLTWAYKKDGPQLERSGLDFEDMHQGLQSAYREAARRGGALIADVGGAFYERSEKENLFSPDGSHPNEAGTLLAAQIIAGVILEEEKQRKGGRQT